MRCLVSEAKDDIIGTHVFLDAIVRKCKIIALLGEIIMDELSVEVWTIHIIFRVKDPEAYVSASEIFEQLIDVLFFQHFVKIGALGLLHECRVQGSWKVRSK